MGFKLAIRVRIVNIMGWEREVEMLMVDAFCGLVLEISLELSEYIRMRCERFGRGLL